MATTTKNKDPKESPLMKQYYGIKAKYPDALLLFRVGDFYETFGEDAVRASNILGIVLTKRQNGAAASMDLAGFPHHSLDTYLPKLVRSGLRVAICDQLEDPKATKTIVKRGVTELVTPGVSYNDRTLDNKSNNFLAAIHFSKHEIGVAFLDISTGEFLVAQGKAEYIDKLLQSFSPGEVLYQKQCKELYSEYFGDHFYTFKLEDWVFTSDYANEKLLNHFGTTSLKGFGIDNLNEGVIAAGAALHYLAETRHNQIRHISTISRISEEKYVWLDRFTIRNLELFNSQNEDATTLFDVVDKTMSPMGSRMMKRWMVLPLKDCKPIEERHDIVAHFISMSESIEELSLHVNKIGDLERLISKVSYLRINPREIVQLKRALSEIEPIKEFCSSSDCEPLKKLVEQINLCKSVRNSIEKEICDDAPLMVSKGGVIKEGVNAELDELRQLAFSGKDYLAEMQKRESGNTGIPSLKIGFNNVFGYYFEVRNTHKDKVPTDWIRKQTLTQAERYITEELKIYETKILGAEEKILTIETQMFNDLVLSLSDFILPIQHNCIVVAQIDCLLSFAGSAISNNYVRPHLNDEMILSIIGGRHPVIEKQLNVGEEYVANNTLLNATDQQMMVITGPNMSGKSALLRQTALIVLMAQMGSYVPAQSAEIGIIDKIFTRVGATDNISSGESTFMVEMNETASILNNLSDRSLILLDEIGRGTSTYDGISIAWAIAAYIVNHSKAKTLFATHYHELNDMADSFTGIKNYNVSVKELNNTVIFIRKLVPGGTTHSFGIHVAEMAGMPKEVVTHAKKLLKSFEHKPSKKGAEALHEATEQGVQLSFFQLDDPVLEQIRDEIMSIDINTLTPVEALMKLNEIKKISGGKGE